MERTEVVVQFWGRKEGRLFERVVACAYVYPLILVLSVPLVLALVLVLLVPALPCLQNWVVRIWAYP
jgi:hypothetical protein